MFTTEEHSGFNKEDEYVDGGAQIVSGQTTSYAITSVPMTNTVSVMRMHLTKICRSVYLGSPTLSSSYPVPHVILYSKINHFVNKW
jgi:hypothetical protein